MTADRQSWFRELEPPPGGVERLRQRLEEAVRPTASLVPRVAIVGAAALAVALALFAVLRNEDGTDREAVASVYQAAPLDRLLGRPIERTELSVAVDEQAVPVSRVESSNPKVRIYRVD